MASTFEPEGFAQLQLDAYNARDLERFCAEDTDDVEVYVLPGLQPVTVGKEALHAHYRDNRFNLPALHAPAIYEVTEQGISRVWFVRG